MSRQVRVGLVGLGFGAEFIPIYQHHPDAELVAICQQDEASLNRIGGEFGIGRRYTQFADMLADPDIDAIHINTPIPTHADMSIAGLTAGKHVACTVPMATTLQECRDIVSAVARSGRNYMMMETAVYTREFLYVKRLISEGRLGRLQFLRGAHQQEMTGWPDYWEGLPPMHYATHAVGPLLALAGTTARAVNCVGSGRISGNLAGKHGSPFAVETALLKLAGSDLAAEVTRSLFSVARQYVESFSAYGSLASFEWPQTEGSNPILFIGEKADQVSIPDYADVLPEPIRRFTTRGVYDEEHEHLSFKQGSGHGGSHPHLAHEFIRSIVEARRPAVDHVTAANWTSVGISAHLSALRDGETVEIEDYGRIE